MNAFGKNIILLFVVFSLIVTYIPCSGAAADDISDTAGIMDENAQFDESSVIVKMKDASRGISLLSEDDAFAELGIDDSEDIYGGIDGMYSLMSGNGEEGRILKLTLENEGRENVLNAVQQLELLPEVEYAQPNYIYTLFDAPNDPYYANQYGLTKIKAPDVWELDIDCSDVVVGVIDSGAMLTHPDIADNLWINEGEIPRNGKDDDGNRFTDDVYGYNFIGNGDGDPSDDQGHGTHVSGIISAVTNNCTGVASAARNARLAELKAFSSQSSSTAYMVEAIKYAKQMGFDIVNMSAGGSTEDETMSRLIKDCSNMLFVCAAGNTGNNNDEAPVYPAYLSTKYDNVISVASTDRNDALSVFNSTDTPGSNYGANSVDVAAPGSSIYSTYISTSGYAYMNGTSMACPAVTSAAAVIKAAHPDWKPSEIKQRLINTSDHVVSLEGKIKSEGRINLYAAVADKAVDVDIEMNGGVYDYTGQEAACQALIEASDGADLSRLITYSYAPGGTDEYVDGLPVYAGEYTVKASFAPMSETAGDVITYYKRAEKTANITILPKVEVTADTGKCSILVDGTGDSRESVIYVLFKRDDMIERILMNEIASMTAEFDIPEELSDCDIYIYVWDNGLKPLSDVHAVLKEEQ